MATIKMPVTPRGAYDPTRPPNALLLSHVRELEKALAQRGRRVRRKIPKTEQQAASYMRHLNRALHHQVVLPMMKRRPLDVPLDGVSPRRARSSLRRRRRTRPTTRKSRR